MYFDSGDLQITLFCLVFRILEPVERRGVYMSDADYRYNQEMMGQLRKIMHTVGFTNDVCSL